MSPRTPYHHGDLRNALVEAAAALAAEGGPEGISVRAAARRVGVTPTAAYRHFAGKDELLVAAKEESTRRLAQAMRRRLAALDEGTDPVRSAYARLDAVGRGYVDFALAEPGLYRTAFGWGSRLSVDEQTELADPEHPHQQLLRVIDELIELEVIPRQDRLGLEMTAWGLVHGLALLLIDGPFAGASAQEHDAIVDQTLRVFGTLLVPMGSA